MVSYGSFQSTPSTENSAVAGNGESVPLINGTKKQVFQAPTISNFSDIATKLVFGWFDVLLHRGNKKNKLDQEDLNMIPLPDDCADKYISEIFEKNWQEELKRTYPSLIRCLGNAFGVEYAYAGVLKFFHDVCLFVGPQVLNAMIYYLRDANAPKSQGLKITALITLSQLAMSLCLRHYFYKCYLTGLRVRSAIIVAIYKKALVLASGERQTRTLGEITNLMSIDAKRLQDLTTYLHAVWYSLLQIFVALFFLWQQLGPSCLGGVLVILIMMPVTKFVAQWMGKMQGRLMKAKDARMEVNSEVLGAMKVIKLQAWEESFKKRIMSFRHKELNELYRYYLGSAAAGMLWSGTPLAVALATFAAYVWSGHDLEVAKALTALALFDILRLPLFMLPQVVNIIVEATISLNRVRSFLLCEEHRSIDSGDLDDIGVQMSKLSAVYESKKPNLKDLELDPMRKELAEKEWEVALLKSQLDAAEQQIGELLTVGGDPPIEEFGNSDFSAQQSASLLCLKRISFECNKGQMIAVVGGVGCGKSSFINAILGEVKELAGTTSVRGNLAYFCQTPFILNATVKDNILFGHVGEPFDEQRYQHALECCALIHDLRNLPKGDMTEIGEKGITLSGGQKARVALARVVYHRASISLIDDALSAVDAHVARDLFHNCITNELMSSQRSVILATNALQFLHHPRVDKIIVIQDGRIVEQGSYTELTSKPKSHFLRFIEVMKESGISSDSAEEVIDSSSEASLNENEGQNKPSANLKSEQRRPATKAEHPVKPVKQEEKKESGLITAETHASGHVSIKVYLAWVKAAGGMWVPFLIIFFYALYEGINVLSKWWLTYWSQHGNSAGSRSQYYYLAIYALINASSPLFAAITTIIIFFFGLRASRHLFGKLLDAALCAPMSFYDTTPIGRVLNRFSKDMYTIDEELVMTARLYLWTLMSVISTIAVISSVTPIFTACLIPIIAYYLIQQNYFTMTYRELKRLDSVNRSPLYALLGETVDGVATIRAFSANESLVNRLTSMLDVQQHAYYLTCAAQCWLGVRLEFIGTLIITFACMSAVVQHGVIGGSETAAGLVGLSISFALTVTQSLNWSVRMASDFEGTMVAVERVEEYCQLEREAARVTKADTMLPTTWPTKGEIIFEGVKLRYRPGLPLTLKGLDLCIPSGAKVGVVGRTGAGKSTLMIAMLRIVELECGQILIDGIDCHSVGLRTLRSKIAVIPQDPVLFSGTIRTNLDPFGDFSEIQLKEVIQRVGLSTPDTQTFSEGTGSSSAIESLEDVVAEGGANFSVGQRQLLVIARALLCGARIVIMDEATAAVDADTDARIQRVMRTEFAGATCITVAHRLNTIMDSDYILVMDDGRAAEFDPPNMLLARGGMFRELVQAASQDK